MIDLPNYIKNSVILTEDDKNKLSKASALPTELQIDKIRVLPHIQELLNAFIGDESTRDTHLQLKAQEYLQHDDIDTALKILFL